MKLFDKYNVDFVLTGHSHCYQRGEYKGTQYVLSGGAGTNDDVKFPFWKGIDKIHLKKDSIGNRIKRKTRKKPVNNLYIDGKKVEEYYNISSVFPTVDILIRQSNYVRFDIQKDTVTFVAYNETGQIIDRKKIPKKTRITSEITIESNTLKFNKGTNPSWFYDGIQLPEQSSTLPIKEPGVYEVEFTDNRGCRVLSEAVEIKD